MSLVSDPGIWLPNKPSSDEVSSTVTNLISCTMFKFIVKLHSMILIRNRLRECKLEFCISGKEFQCFKLWNVFLFFSILQLVSFCCSSLQLHVSQQTVIPTKDVNIVSGVKLRVWLATQSGILVISEGKASQLFVCRFWQIQEHESRKRNVCVRKKLGALKRMCCYHSALILKQQLEKPTCRSWNHRLMGKESQSVSVKADHKPDEEQLPSIKAASYLLKKQQAAWVLFLTQNKSPAKLVEANFHLEIKV